MSDMVNYGIDLGTTNSTIATLILHQNCSLKALLWFNESAWRTSASRSFE